MQVVLVTGGNGFLGTHTVRALLNGGRTVPVIDTRLPRAEGQAVLGDRLSEVVIGSAGDWRLVVDVVQRFRPDAIVHIAAEQGPTVSVLTAIDGNLAGVLNILEAARIFGVRQVIHLSTISVLASIQGERIDASHPLIDGHVAGTGGFYAASKIAAEAFCLAYATVHGLDIRTIRVAPVYGFGAPSDRNGARPMVEGSLRRQAVLIPGDGSAQFDYTYVDDVVALTLASLAAPMAADRVFFAATGQPWKTQREFAATVADVVPGTNITFTGGAAMPRHAARFAIDQGRTQLGWAPRYTLAEGITAYIAQYQAFLQEAAE